VSRRGSTLASLPGTRRVRPALGVGLGAAVVVWLVALEITSLLSAIVAVPHTGKLTLVDLRVGWEHWRRAADWWPWAALGVADRHLTGAVVPAALGLLVGLVLGFAVWRASGRIYGGPPAAGRGQHGTAHWRDERDLHDGLFRWSPGGPPAGSRPGGGSWPRTGVVVGSAATRALWVANREDHLLLLGTPGSSKSRGVFLPTLGVVAAEGSHSVVVFDAKGELYAHTAGRFRSAGYQVRRFDLRSPAAGGEASRWNPVAPVKAALAAGDPGRATQLAWQVAHAFAFRGRDDTSTELWPQASEATIAALILALAAGEPAGAAEADPSFRWPAPEEQHLGSVYRSLVNAGPGAIELDAWIGRLPRDHPAVDAWAVMAASAGSERTRASILTTATTDLRLLAEPDLRWLLGADGSPLTSIGTSPSALFVVVPDDDQTRYPLASLFLAQLISELTRLADRSPAGRLPVPVLFLLDEFGNFPAVGNFSAFLTAARSRGMRAVVALQSLAQLDARYGPHSAKVLLEALSTWVYLSTSSPETAKLISDRCGSYTTKAEGRSAPVGTWSTRPLQQSTESESLVGRPLLTPDEVLRWPAGQSLVLAQRKAPARLPLQDIAALPFFPDITSRHDDADSSTGPLETPPTWWPGRAFDPAPAAAHPVSVASTADAPAPLVDPVELLDEERGYRRRVEES